MKRVNDASISPKQRSSALPLAATSRPSRKRSRSGLTKGENEILGTHADATVIASVIQSGQSTSKKAAEILVRKRIGFEIPTAIQRQNLLVAFAKLGKVVYGKAFDIVKLSEPVDLNDSDDVERKLAAITIYEIKSSKKDLPTDFSGFFFALTGAEILVAQSLRSQFKFVLVNTRTEAFLEMKLGEIFARARGIYSTWSICF